MRPINPLPSLLFAVCFASCHVETPQGQLPPVVICGNTLSGKYEITGAVKNEDNTLSVSIWPEEFTETAPEKYDILVGSVFDGKIIKSDYASISKEESFAFERITERNKSINEQCEQYRKQMAESGVLDDPAARSVFVTAYIQGLPTLVADDILFGQPAGSDLSDWFRFTDANLIDVFGWDYRMEGKAQERNQFISASKYFIKDKLMPLKLQISPVETPAEINTDNWTGEWRYSGDDIITLSVSIPVRFERYWDWCKALYGNPAAAQEVQDGTIQVKIPFVRK